MSQLHPDAKIIQREGGPSELARKLGFDMRNKGAQRVHNWMKRGIPADIKLKHIDIFLPELSKEPEHA